MTRLLRQSLAVGGTMLALASPRFASPARAAQPETSASAVERLANEAYEQHAAGKYAEAIATYLKAYEISKAAAVLFNVATIYDRKLHERGLAEDYYRRYLRAPDVDPEIVKKATERLTALKREDDEAAARNATPAVTPVPATPAPVIAPPPATPPAPVTSSTASPPTPAASSSRPLRTAGIVVGAVGIAGVGASMVFGLLAKGKNDEANAICDGAACSSDRGVTLARQAGTFATVSTVAFVSGVALVGGAVAMFFLAPKGSSSSTTARFTVAPQIGATQVGMGIGGSF